MNELFKENYLLEIDYLRLFGGIILFSLLIYILRKHYIKYGISRDDKNKFFLNLFPFGVSILLIVIVIKSSLALSLGLIGALSIIRFRTAIKETEQIITLLMVMALSISIAAEKEILAIIFTVLYILTFRKKSIYGDSSSRKIIQISFDESSILDLDKVYITDPECNLLRISKTVDNKYNIEYEILKEGDQKKVIDYFTKVLKLNFNYVII